MTSVIKILKKLWNRIDQLLPEVSYQNSRSKRNWKIAVVIHNNQQMYFVYNRLEGTSWVVAASFDALHEARKFIKDNYEFPENH